MTETAPDRLPIGADLGLLLDAVRVVVTGRVVSMRNIQRRVYVGFAKAGRLLILLEQEGVITRTGSGKWECLVQRADLDATLERIRKTADA